MLLSLWLNRNFNRFFIVGSLSTKILSFDKTKKELSLIPNTGTTKIAIQSFFNGKKIVFMDGTK